MFQVVLKKNQVFFRVIENFQVFWGLCTMDPTLMLNIGVFFSPRGFFSTISDAVFNASQKVRISDVTPSQLNTRPAFSSRLSQASCAE